MGYHNPVEDELAIRDLCARYIDAINRIDDELWKSTWAEDASWSLLGQDLSGRDNLVTFWRNTMGVFNFVIMTLNSGTVDIQGDRATGRWYVKEQMSIKAVIPKEKGSSPEPESSSPTISKESVDDDIFSFPRLPMSANSSRFSASRLRALANETASSGLTFIPVTPSSTIQPIPEPTTSLMTVALPKYMASSSTMPKASVRSMAQCMAMGQAAGTAASLAAAVGGEVRSVPLAGVTDRLRAGGAIVELEG